MAIPAVSENRTIGGVRGGMGNATHRHDLPRGLESVHLRPRFTGPLGQTARKTRRTAQPGTRLHVAWLRAQTDRAAAERASVVEPSNGPRLKYDSTWVFHASGRLASGSMASTCPTTNQWQPTVRHNTQHDTAYCGSPNPNPSSDDERRD